MTQLEEKAIKMRDEAVKKLSYRGFFYSLFGSNKIDQAISYYEKSANLFKMAKNWKEAGLVLREVGELYGKKNEEFESASSFVNAANCFKKCDNKEAVRNFTRAIAIYTNSGKFAMAAKYHYAIADIYEHQEFNMEKALEHYEQAAEYYQYEDSFNQAKPCLLKIAENASFNENYNKAITIYQQIYENELSQNLLKYNAKDHFMQAVLCQICLDSSLASNMIENFLRQCPIFENSREHNFLRVILETLQLGDLDKFTNTVTEYDRISKLSTWHVTILLRIKRKIENGPDLK